MFAKNGEITAPCGVPSNVFLDRTVLHDTGAQPLPDQRHEPKVSDPMRHEPQQPVVIHRIEEPLDDGIHHPIQLRTIHPDRKRIQRVVLATTRSESIREADIAPCQHFGAHLAMANSRLGDIHGALLL